MAVIEIKKLADCPNGQQEAAAIFADGYYDILSQLSKDRDKLIQAFTGVFQEDVCFLAYMDGNAVGLAACANNKERAVELDRRKMARTFGWFIGFPAYLGMRSEFHTQLPYPDDTGYIECVATVEAARGKGVATTLIQYMLQELPYKKFILEVVDTNANAIRLYEKLGFVEFERKPEKNPKRTGFTERIYMKRTGR